MAARNGHLECLRFLFEINCSLESGVSVAAAGNGHVHCLRFAHENGCPWTNDVTALASYNDHIDCLQYAHEHGCSWSDSVTFLAANNGHIESLTYALEHGCEVLHSASKVAAEQGHFDCLQLLHAFQAPWDSRVSYTAAKQGHLHILQYLHEHHCPWDVGIFKGAIEHSHLDCIQYAHIQGLALPTEDSDLCDLAALFGNLDILKYLHENGVPWGECTVYNGVRDGHLDLVQYAITEGCDWDRHKCTLQALYHNKENWQLLRFILSQWTPSQYQLQNYATYAFFCNKVGLLRYLVEEQHYSLNNNLYSVAMASNSLSCVQYCYEKRCREVEFNPICEYYTSDVHGWTSGVCLLQYVQILLEKMRKVADPVIRFMQGFNKHS